MLNNSTFIGKSCSLIPLTVSDVSSKYVNWLNNLEINRYLEVRHSRVSIETQESFVRKVLESSTGVIFKILTGENIFIGVVKLEIDLKTQSIEVGIMIGELNFHSKGIGSQCLALIEEFATLNNLFLLTAGLMSSNSASRNLFNKNGYVEVGTKPYLLDAPSADEYVIRLQKMIKSK